MLLDTHIAIWAALDPNALSQVERRGMAGADTQIGLSAVAVWELRLKWNSFHISGARRGPGRFCSRGCVRCGDLPLTAHHAAAELAHPLEHEDPFDTLLLVQAQEEGMQLFTCDAKLAGHPFAVTGGRA